MRLHRSKSIDPNTESYYNLSSTNTVVQDDLDGSTIVSMQATRLNAEGKLFKSYGHISASFLNGLST